MTTIMSEGHNFTTESSDPNERPCASQESKILACDTFELVGWVQFAHLLVCGSWRGKLHTNSDPSATRSSNRLPAPRTVYRARGSASGLDGTFVLLEFEDRAPTVMHVEENLRDVTLTANIYGG
jgi:hypothetical protein